MPCPVVGFRSPAVLFFAQSDFWVFGQFYGASIELKIDGGLITHTLGVFVPVFMPVFHACTLYSYLYSYLHSTSRGAV